MSDLHVVAAGSLLEFVLSEIPSLGVGRLSNLFLYPLSFGEFLEAVGEEAFRKMFLAADSRHPVEDVFHNRLLERLRIFQILGGMPAVVNAYRRGEEARSCQEILAGLLVTLRDDFAKYKKKAPVLKLREVFESISLQTGGKFKFARITEAATSTGYSEALDLLVQAGLAYKVYHSTARGIPLGAQINPKKFKVILLDSGLHQSLARLDISSWLVQNPLEMIQKGALSELFAGLELVAHAPPALPSQLYYWHRESPASNAEVDYILQKGEQIVPIEVKAGTKGQMQSLFLFLKERGLPLGIRLSHENFGRYDKIITVPLYAAERLFSGELQ
jgi:predicted AAA+ superfamily ATPase